MRRIVASIVSFFRFSGERLVEFPEDFYPKPICTPMIMIPQNLSSLVLAVSEERHPMTSGGKLRN